MWSLCIALIWNETLYEGRRCERFSKVFCSSESEMKLFQLRMGIYVRYRLYHVYFSKCMLGLFSKPILRVNEISPSNKSTLSIMLKGLHRKATCCTPPLDHHSQRKSYKNWGKHLLIFKTTRISFCFLVVLENILTAKIKLHVRLPLLLPLGMKF